MAEITDFPRSRFARPTHHDDNISTWEYRVMLAYLVAAGREARLDMVSVEQAMLAAILADFQTYAPEIAAQMLDIWAAWLRGSITAEDRSAALLPLFHQMAAADDATYGDDTPPAA